MHEVLIGAFAIAVAILTGARMICTAIRRSDDERSRRLQLYVANSTSVRRNAGATTTMRSAP